MNSTLDFVNRARHAWTEFRQPSQFDTSPPHAQQVQVERGDGRYEPSELIQPNPQLTDFRLLVGIWQDKSFTSKHGFQMNRRPQASLGDRPSPNLGIYSTVCDCEIKAKRNYKSAARLINFCYGLQIIVAAALTALGAAAASNKAVTAFGAINTCIAGFLTYLKGSGLPHRIKYFQHEWAKIREYIEQRERDFTFPNTTLSVAEEVSIIRHMYESLRLDIENNRPDRFVSSGGGNLSRLGAAPPPPPPAAMVAPPLARPAPTASFGHGDREHWGSGKDYGERARELVQDARGFKGVLEGRLGELERVVGEKGKGVEGEVQGRVRDVARGIEDVGERLAGGGGARAVVEEGRGKVGDFVKG